MIIIKLVVICCLIFIGIIPVRVLADTSTYVILNTGCNEIAHNSSRYFLTVISNNTSEVRAIILGTSSNKSLYFVSQNTFKYFNNNNSSSACPYSAPTSSNPYSGQGYYYISTGINSQYFGYEEVPFVSDTSNIANAIYYTFGDGAVDPEPEVEPTDYGNLILKGYKTDIAGSGNAAVNNKDTISWEPVDSNGNDITNCQVRIRAIPGQYSAESRTTLLQKVRTDFITDVLHATDLGVYPAREEKHSYSWGQVIDVLSLPFLSITSLIQRDNHWIKNGWIYQIRLEDEENNYTGEWQTVYTATAAGVQNDLTVINSTSLNQELINVITEINNSNDVTNNWTIINIIIVPSPDPTPTPEPGTDPGGNSDWFSALLQAIVDLISGILSFLGNLIGNLIDAIVSLFQPAEFTINNFNEYKLELKQNSGIFGQSIDFISTVKNTFLGVQYQEPIIHWTGISFGETELIPAADYNLNDYVTMWGLGDFRTMAYLCSDGFIYVSLIVLIVRKLNEVLKK